MRTIYRPSPEGWQRLCCRAQQDDALIEDRVKDILSRIRNGGDDALRAVVREIEGSVPDDFKVGPGEIAATAEQVPANVKEAILNAKGRIAGFHSRQIPRETVWHEGGLTCMRRFLPISRVGIYIPGGSAPLFSTILMLAVPAKLAGCREIFLCTPPRKDGSIAPEILYTADLCGVSGIYRIGGAQAIAALAYGAGGVPRVDKIFGPGNRYVMKAKQLLAAEGHAIDMPAGPSEVMVMADDSAVPAFVAADLLSQAEHGPDSQVLLVTCSERLADAALAASIFHYGEIPIPVLKRALVERNINVRI